MDRCAFAWRVAAIGGLVAFAPVPVARAQWLPPWGAASPGEIERSLEAQGYGLIAPLMRRPGVYLADVSAGPAGYQRLIVDARSGQILERFVAPGRTWGPALAARDEEFGEPPPPGVGTRRGAPASPAVPAGCAGGEEVLRRSSERPYSGRHQSVWRGGSAGRSEAQAEVGFRRTQGTGDQASRSTPPLPPPAPREAATPDGSGSPATKSADTHEFASTEDRLPSDRGRQRPTDVRDDDSKPTHRCERQAEGEHHSLRVVPIDKRNKRAPRWDALISRARRRST